MKITLSEGYIFDILSIYQVKIIKSNNDEINLNNFNKLKNEISEQIGEKITNDILNSQEYKDLYKANLKTFELVDAVKINPCLGKEVDLSNYKRFLAKQNLQKKWFNNLYTEIKIGY